MGHPDISEYLTNLSSHNWLSNGYSMYDGNTSDFSISDATPWPLATLAAASSNPPESIMLDADDTTNSIRNSNTVLTSQQLTYLISEIQQQLKKPEGGPWNTDNTVSLDDYPVGTILKLSQQFSTVAGPILSNAVSLNRSTEDAEYQDENEKRASTSNTVDTPIMLLVMCGYMWLVRIYSVVLGHLQDHLNMSISQHPGAMSGFPGLGPSLSGPRSSTGH